MPSEFRALWALDPAVEFLNHGSFGAAPTAVLEAQSTIRQRMESEPVAFFSRDLEGLLDAARTTLGAFVGADPDDLAFVDNATTGVNAVIRWLPLAAGDELLTTDHEYNACRNVLAVAAEATGARVVTVPLPFPSAGPEDVVERVLAAVTARTRLAVLDHVTSATALVLPIEELVSELAARGVDTLVDGAHAPGMLDVQVDQPGRRVLRRQPAQVGLCAQGRGLPARPPRPAGRLSSAGHQPRPELRADRSVPFPAGGRLDRDPGSECLALGAHRARAARVTCYPEAGRRSGCETATSRSAGATCCAQRSRLPRRRPMR